MGVSAMLPTETLWPYALAAIPLALFVVLLTRLFPCWSGCWRHRCSHRCRLAWPSRSRLLRLGYRSRASSFPRPQRSRAHCSPTRPRATWDWQLRTFRKRPMTCVRLSVACRPSRTTRRRNRTSRFLLGGGQRPVPQAHVRRVLSPEKSVDVRMMGQMRLIRSPRQPAPAGR